MLREISEKFAIMQRENNDKAERDKEALRNEQNQQMVVQGALGAAAPAVMGLVGCSIL